MFQQNIPVPVAWEIQSGSTKVMLNLFESDAMVYIDSLRIDEEDFSPIPEQFFTALKVCSINKNKTDREGIYFEGNMSAAPDLFRMAFYKMEVPMQKFWISEDSAKIISTVEGLQEYRVNHSWVHFKLADGSTFSVRKKHDILYPFKEMMKIYETYSKDNNPDVTSFTFPKALNETMGRVMLLADDNILKRPVVELVFGKENLMVKGQSTVGNIEETITWEEEFPYEHEFSVKIDSAFLSEALDKSNEFYFLQSSGTNALVVGGDEFLHITQAMRG
jgi:hypothetical protein